MRFSKRFGVIGAALAVATVLTGVSAGAQAEPTQRRASAAGSSDAPPLLEVGAPTSAPTSEAQVTETAKVDVDTSLLRTGKAQSVSVDVLDDTLEVDLEPVASGAPGWSAWSGEIAGTPASSATIVRKGDDVGGVIATPDGVYRIRTTAPGQQVVQVVGGDFPDRLDDVVTPPAPPAPRGKTSNPVRPGNKAGSAAGDLPTAAGDVAENSIVDVLVAYTPATLSAYGTQSALDTEIALAITVSNTAYADSGVVGRLRLVGTTALTENLTLSQESLNWISNNGDGHSDQIHALRDSLGADVVSAWVIDSSACGLGWLLNSLSNPANGSLYGFSTVHAPCAVSNFSFVHELGHNMGLDHDRYVAPNPVMYPYSVGYVDVANRFRTIMAYNNACSAAGTNCTRIGRFSNPDLTYNGFPTGLPSSGPNPADNRQALNNTQGFVASWKGAPGVPSITSVTPSNASASISFTMPAFVGANPITGVVVTPYIGATAQAPVNFSGTTSPRTITGLTNGTTYTFKIAAVNSWGTSPQSASSSVVTPRTVPGAPTIGAATRGSASAKVSWTAPASNGGSAITGYTVTPYIGATAQTAQTFTSTATTQTVTGLTNGTSYTFKVAAVNAAGTGAASSTSSNVVIPNPKAPPVGDFNGDQKTDVAVFRPSNGGWYVNGSAVTYLGLSGDIPVPGDYDGNGTSDLAVFRPSTGAWFVNGSSSPTYFGLSGDVPVPGDYDGDGDTDFAVFRPSNGGWYVFGAGVSYHGLSTDKPVAADYDGDGDTDRAVYRPSIGAWFVQGSATQYLGASSDVPLPGDYDGNGTVDLAVFRPSTGTWYSSSGSPVSFGLSTDVPVPGQYDGDAAVDIAVFRPANGGWYIDGSPTTFYGLSGDTPAPRNPALA